MALSGNAREATFKVSSDEIFLALLTISHPDLGVDDPLRISSDTVDTISNGETFQSVPFEFILPGDKDGRVIATDIRVEGVTDLILPGLRAITSRPSLLIQVVLASTPDVVEVSFDNFFLRKADYDAIQITARFTQDSDKTTPFGLFFTPSNFESVFTA